MLGSVEFTVGKRPMLPVGAVLSMSGLCASRGGFCRRFDPSSKHSFTLESRADRGDGLGHETGGNSVDEPRIRGDGADCCPGEPSVVLSLRLVPARQRRIQRLVRIVDEIV